MKVTLKGGHFNVSAAQLHPTKRGHFGQQNFNMPPPHLYTLITYSSLGYGTSKTQ